MPNPALDPLKDVTLTGDLEKDGEKMSNAMLDGFKDRIKQENARRSFATDSEYWCCLYFHSRAQKDQFLKAVGWFDLGDKYVDGGKVAEKLGIALDAANVTFKEETQDRMITANLNPIGGE